jgi:hypothetical protein
MVPFPEHDSGVEVAVKEKPNIIELVNNNKTNHIFEKIFICRLFQLGRNQFL